MSIKRQDIITALKAKLATILVANSYHTDIGAHVYEHKTGNWMANEIPGINVRDVKDLIGIHQTVDHLHHLKIELEIVVANGTSSATEMRKMIADVYKALGTDRSLGGTADDLELGEDGGDELIIQEEDQSIGGAIIRLEYLFHTLAFQENVS